MTRQSICERVTEAIVAELERGVAPWLKPWEGAGNPVLPYNATTQRRYNGVNVLLSCEFTATEAPRGSRSARRRGSAGTRSRKYEGARATQIVYTSTFSKHDTEEETEARLGRRYP